MGLFRLCLLLVLLGTTSPAAEVEPRGVRPGRLADLQGEIVEVGCYLRDGHRGEAHKGCALACLQNGGQLGLLEDDSGVLYPLAGAHPASDPSAAARELIAARVTVRGRVHERAGSRVLVIEEIEALGR